MASQQAATPVTANPLSRNEKEAQKVYIYDLYSVINILTIRQCRDREKKSCLFTGPADPEACHIIPFAFNSI